MNRDFGVNANFGQKSGGERVLVPDTNSTSNKVLTHSILELLTVLAPCALRCMSLSVLSGLACIGGHCCFEACFLAELI